MLGWQAWLRTNVPLISLITIDGATIYRVLDRIISKIPGNHHYCWSLHASNIQNTVPVDTVKYSLPVKYWASLYVFGKNAWITRVKQKNLLPALYYRTKGSERVSKV